MWWQFAQSNVSFCLCLQILFSVEIFECASLIQTPVHHVTSASTGADSGSSENSQNSKSFCRKSFLIWPRSIFNHPHVKTTTVLELNSNLESLRLSIGEDPSTWFIQPTADIWNGPGTMCSPAATWETSTVVLDRLNVISSGSVHPCLSEVYPTTT
jgi:hypothetical protein